MGVPEDSPLRSPDQIPFPDPAPPVQNPSNVDEEEKTPSMRKLVQEIDSHMELVDLEVTSNLCAGKHPEGIQIQPPTTVQQTENVASFTPTDPAA